MKSISKGCDVSFDLFLLVLLLLGAFGSYVKRNVTKLKNKGELLCTTTLVLFVCKDILIGWVCLVDELWFSEGGSIVINDHLIRCEPA